MQDTNLLFSVNDLCLQVSRNDSPPETKQSLISIRRYPTVLKCDRTPCVGAAAVPLIGAEQDDVLRAEPQGSAGLLDGVVALEGEVKDIFT